MRIGIRVVIDEGDYFALGFADAEVALFGGTHLASRNEPYARVARQRLKLHVRRLGVRQHQAFPVLVALDGKRRKALLQHPACIGARDDYAYERRMVQRTRRHSLCVVSEDAQPVEHGEGIYRHLLDGRRLERAELVAEAYAHRGLDDLRAA